MEIGPIFSDYALHRNTLATYRNERQRSCSARCLCSRRVSGNSDVVPTIPYFDCTENHRRAVRVVLAYCRGSIFCAIDRQSIRLWKGYFRNLKSEATFEFCSVVLPFCNIMFVDQLWQNVPRAIQPKARHTLKIKLTTNFWVWTARVRYVVRIERHHMCE